MKTVAQLNNAFIYQKENLILGEVNLQIREREFVYLVGKTGTGKTSLLRTLYGDLMLTEGTGEVAGFLLHQLNWRTIPFLRRKLGIVFQDFHLLTDRNIEENLLFALEATDWQDEREMMQRVDNVLANVGINHKRYAMPYELSGGEQQRVAIGRALLNDPILILADEPTGNLDPETSEEIISLLKQISTETNTAVLVGSHDFYTIQKYPARTLRCENGKVVMNYEL